MKSPHRQERVSRKERIARAAIGMPAEHPERVTRKPSRAEWKRFAAWLAELWPNDEYTTIITDAWRRGLPPESRGWS
jgi:hypothetical protein